MKFFKWCIWTSHKKQRVHSARESARARACVGGGGKGVRYEDLTPLWGSRQVACDEVELTSYTSTGPMAIFSFASWKVCRNGYKLYHKLPKTRMCSFGVPVYTKGRSQNHKTFSTRPMVPKHVALNEQLMHNDNGTKCQLHTWHATTT